MTITVDRPPKPYIDARITFLAILFATHRNDQKALFDIAFEHQPRLATLSRRPQCDVCDTWMCNTFRTVLDEVVRLKLMPPISTEETGSG